MKLKTFHTIARRYNARAGSKTLPMLEEHLVNGLSLRDVAKKYQVSFQHVSIRKQQFLRLWQATAAERLAVKLVEIIEREPQLNALERQKFVRAIEGIAQ